MEKNKKNNHKSGNSTMLPPRPCALPPLLCMASLLGSPCEDTLRRGRSQDTRGIWSGCPVPSYHNGRLMKRCPESRSPGIPESLKVQRKWAGFIYNHWTEFVSHLSRMILQVPRPVPPVEPSHKCRGARLAVPAAWTWMSIPKFIA